MPIAKPFVTEAAYEDSGIHLMARVLGHSGSAIAQADISSITLNVYDKAESGATVATATLTVSSTVFDTLQTDARWTKDTTGYNFRYATEAAQLPQGSKTYRFEFKFTPDSGAPFFIVFEVPTVDLYTS